MKLSKNYYYGLICFNRIWKSPSRIFFHFQLENKALEETVDNDLLTENKKKTEVEIVASISVPCYSVVLSVSLKFTTET